MALNWRRKAASFGFSFASNCHCHSASAQLEAKQDAPTHPLPEQRFLNLVGFEFDAMGQDGSHANASSARFTRCSAARRPYNRAHNKVTGAAGCLSNKINGLLNRTSTTGY